MPILTLEKIHRSYLPQKEVIRGVSLSVEPGEVLGLIGRNGAGKTTLLRIAAGILKPHRGAVRVFDMDPWDQAVEVKRRLGYAAETQAVPAHMSIRQLIDLHRALYPSWDDALERRLLGRLAIDDRSRLKNLSKGEGRKAILLCAIAHRPELLILDEPAGGLDPSTRREFLEAAIELLSEGGSTILFSSHHMADVERMANRVVVIEDGNKLLDLELNDFRQNYCIAVMPARAAESAVALSAVDGFVRSRKRGDSLYAVFARQPEDVQEELSNVGISDALCTRSSLEETFVALVGDES